MFRLVAMSINVNTSSTILPPSCHLADVRYFYNVLHIPRKQLDVMRKRNELSQCHPQRQLSQLFVLSWNTSTGNNKAIFRKE